MKKLMIAAAIVCAAAISQAASIDWTSDAVAYAVSAADVVDNGNYAAATSGSANRMSKGAYTYVLTLLQAGESIGSANGSIEFYSNKFSMSGIEIAGAEKGSTYDYTIVITGTQPSITGKTSDTYDYSKATLTTTLSGEVTTAPFSDTSLLTGVPTSWTVSGITKKEDPPLTPEPTSGLLMLLGMAGLALRRKQK